MSELLDPKHKAIRDTLRLVGPIVVAVGALFIAVAMVSFFSAGPFERPRYFWCAFVGMPLLFVGIVISKFAFLGAVSRYTAGEVAPVGKDVANYMVASTKDSIRDIAAAVGEGFASAATPTVAGSRCRNCNAENDPSANFCDRCGAPLATLTRCTKCGTDNDVDAHFCDHCGAAIA